MFEKLANIDLLHSALIRVRKSSGWKERTQRYDEDWLFRLIDLQKRLADDTYRPKVAKQFFTKGRGKKRVIDSLDIDDKLVVFTYVDNFLLPVIRKKLIYDNSATLKGKGVKHFRNRLKKFLLHSSPDEYILIGDFRKYFDNIRHEDTLEMFKRFGFSEEDIQIVDCFLKTQAIDVSYMSDTEYSTCMDKLFSSVDYYNMHVNKKGNKWMRKHLSIGNPLTQLIGIAYTYFQDNYCKIVKGIKKYAKYMDDFYAIGTKEQLQSLVNDLNARLKSKGVFLNLNKTQIVPLKHTFTMLHYKYQYVNNELIIRPDKSSFTRERHKIVKVFKKGRDMTESYRSWRGMIVAEFGVIKSVRNVDNIFERSKLAYEH